LEPPLFKRLINLFFKFEKWAVERVLWVAFQPSIFLKSSINGYYIFLAKNGFYKVVLRNHEFLRRELKNLNYIHTNLPSVAPFVPEYRFDTFLFGKILIQRGEVLEPVLGKKEQYRFARKILTVLQQMGVRRHSCLDELTNVKKGLDWIQGLLDGDVFRALQRRVADVLENNVFSIGPCHGDFHSRNFMRKGTRDLIIDLDCFRSASIQELDGIYFIVQRIIDDIPGTWWLETIEFLQERRSFEQADADFLNGIYGLGSWSGALMLYFLDRLGQDLDYGLINESRARSVAMGFVREIART